MDDVRIAVEQRAIVLGVSIVGAQNAGSSTCAPAIAYTRNELPSSAQEVRARMSCGSAAADDVGDLGEDVADVERLGHRVEQPIEAVDPLAAERFRAAKGVVLQRQREQIGDRRRSAPDARR